MSSNKKKLWVRLFHFTKMADQKSLATVNRSRSTGTSSSQENTERDDSQSRKRSRVNSTESPAKLHHHKSRIEDSQPTESPNVTARKMDPEKNNPTPCTTCRKHIPEKGKGSNSMECDQCKHWVCFDCLGMKSKTYTAINSDDSNQLKFFCKKCLDEGTSLQLITLKLNKILEGNETRFNSVERKISNLQNSLEKKIDEKVEQKTKEMFKELREEVDDSIKAFNAKLEKRVKDTEQAFDAKLELLKEDRSRVNKQEFTEVKMKVLEEINTLKGSLNKDISNGPISPDARKSVVEETVKDVSSEMKDRESRKNNLIIHGIKEPALNLKKDVEREDLKMFSKICDEALSVDITEDDIINITRLGQKKQKGRDHFA